MPNSSTRSLLLLLPVLLAVACAPPGDDGGEAIQTTDELSDTDASESPKELAWECPRPCILTAAPPPTAAERRARSISDKLNSLDEWTRGWIFAAPVGDIVETGSDEGFQRYEGFFGPAVIFTSYQGTYISYGALVGAWERTWTWDSDLNPPLNDPYGYGTSVRQDFDAPGNGHPCFQDASLYIVMREDGSTATTLETRYLNSFDPDWPYTTPPEYSFPLSTPLPNIFNEPPSPQLWCGPQHPVFTDPTWQDPSAGEFDPSTI